MRFRVRGVPDNLRRSDLSSLSWTARLSVRAVHCLYTKDPLMSAVKTGGADDIAKAQVLILQAREKLLTAQHHLMDEGRMIPVLTIGSVLDELTGLLAEIGLM